MKVLIIHNRMMSHFKLISRELARCPDNEVVFITAQPRESIPGVKKILYRTPDDAGLNCHPYLERTQSGVLRGQAVARIVNGLKKDGFIPDIILGHQGWGELLFLKEIHPHVPLLGLFEFYHRSDGPEIGFNREEPVDLNTKCRASLESLINLANTQICDAGTISTRWQYLQYPENVRHMLTVIHQGIDTDLCAPDPGAAFALPDGSLLTCDDTVITYTSPNLEPYRGFETLIKAIDPILRKLPTAQIVIVGEDGVSYSRPLPGEDTYRSKYLREYYTPSPRVCFLDPLPFETYVRLLQVSTVHVYLSYPYILSWSMLEAMSCGCAVVGSDTPPVAEVIRHGRNGWLVDFFDPQALAGRVYRAATDVKTADRIRESARQTILTHYSFTDCYNQYYRLMQAVMNGWHPNPAGDTPKK